MTYIIYHEVAPGRPCPDGLAAAWVAKRAMPKAKAIGRTYNDRRRLLLEKSSCDEIYFVDFSLPAKELEDIASQGVKVVVLDHHKTALENLEGLSDRVLLRFDMSKCGATMCWAHFFPGQPMPEFLRYIEDRDLWRHKLPQSAEVHAAYASTGRSFELFDRLAKMTAEEFIAEMVPIGAPAVEERRGKVAAIAQRRETGTVAGYPGIPFVALSPDGSEDWLTSDICQTLYLANPRALFVACWCPGSGKWSLRSNQDGNNTDVGAIANAHGGGGHRNAAGFSAQP